MKWLAIRFPTMKSSLYFTKKKTSQVITRLLCTKKQNKKKSIKRAWFSPIYCVLDYLLALTGCRPPTSSQHISNLYPKFEESYLHRVIPCLNTTLVEIVLNPMWILLSITNKNEIEKPFMVPWRAKPRFCAEFGLWEIFARLQRFWAMSKISKMLLTRYYSCFNMP